MRKLHLKLYLAIVGALFAFLAATAMLWHALVAPHGVAWGLEGAARYAAQLLSEESAGLRYRYQISVPVFVSSEVLQG
jgi:hypothetical protein